MAQTAPATTPKFSIELLEVATGQVTRHNDFSNTVDAFLQLSIIDRDLTAPPGSENDGDIYIPTATATGDFATHEDDIAVFNNGGYLFYTPEEGWTAWVADEDIYIRFDGTSWVDWMPVSVANGITASTTQSQGQEPLTAILSVVDTCANANDVVTLPAAAVGRSIYVANDGANTVQVFPASGDSIDGGSVDASVTIAAGARNQFIAQDATDWIRLT